MQVPKKTAALQSKTQADKTKFHFLKKKILLCLRYTMDCLFKNRFIPLTLCLLLLASFQLQMQSFVATYQGTDIRLEWKVSDENGVSNYEIARKKDGDASYSRLAEVPGTGSGTYSWTDDNLYKDGDAMENISYRLGAQTTSGPRYFYANIQHSPTAVQRSWGSIKSMFR